MPAKIDISGQRFGRLTVVCEAGRKGGQVTWICRCDCGNEHIAKGRDLRCGDVKSCGCIQPNYGKHVIGTRLYSIWKAMRKRCSNPNDYSWRIYGGKGIKVCDDWMNSFEAFKSWSLENGYSDDLSIDRINSCGDYEPSNCRWATPYQQANNTSRNRVIEWNGEKLTAAQWDRRLGFSRGTVSRRIDCGWSLERAMTQPQKTTTAKKNKNGETMAQLMEAVAV